MDSEKVSVGVGTEVPYTFPIPAKLPVYVLVVVPAKDIQVFKLAALNDNEYDGELQIYRGDDDTVTILLEVKPFRDGGVVEVKDVVCSAQELREHIRVLLNLQPGEMSLTPRRAPEIMRILDRRLD